MQLSKKTTISFPMDLYEFLAHLAQQRHLSIAELVRDACRKQYSFELRAERLLIVDQLSAFCLPVGSPGEIERESVAKIEVLP